MRLSIPYDCIVNFHPFPISLLQLNSEVRLQLHSSNAALMHPVFLKTSCHGPLLVSLVSYHVLFPTEMLNSGNDPPENL